MPRKFQEAAVKATSLKLIGLLLVIVAAVVFAGSLPGLPQASSMPSAATPALDPAVYHHVAQITWVVSDVDRVADYWQRLGIRDIHRAREVKYPNLTYRGKPDSATTKQVTARVGELEI